jgi:hypothetical protein
MSRFMLKNDQIAKTGSGQRSEILMTKASFSAGHPSRADESAIVIGKYSTAIEEGTCVWKLQVSQSISRETKTTTMHTRFPF